MPTYHFHLSSSSPGGAQHPGYELCSSPGHQVRSRLPAATDWPPPATTSSLHSITEQVHRLNRHVDFLREMSFTNISSHTLCSVLPTRHLTLPVWFLCERNNRKNCHPKKKVLSSRETEGRPSVFTCCSSSDKKSSQCCCRASYSSAGVLMAGSPRVCND